MQTKLTLRLDDALIRRAKAWARTRGTSLSEAVAAMFAQLPDEPDATVPDTGPWTRRLIGAGGPGAAEISDEEARRQHGEYLERKYA